MKGMGSSLAMPHPSPNIPVELTVHSAGFLAVPGLGGCGPQLTGSWGAAGWCGFVFGVGGQREVAWHICRAEFPI